MCAVAYACLVEDLDRQFAAQTQAVLLANVMGGDVDLPDRARALARLDEMLCAEPEGTRPVAALSRTELLREAVGLPTRTG